MKGIQQIVQLFSHYFPIFNSLAGSPPLLPAIFFFQSIAMALLKYFPFGDQFDLRMGTSVFKSEDPLVEVEPEYLEEIHSKRRLLGEDHGYYYQSLQHTLAAQWEVVEKILKDLSLFYPQHFLLETRGDVWTWTNRLTCEQIQFEFGNNATLPFEPLDWVGRQVQEDLVILGNDGQAAIVAAQLCSANGWSISDKFGQSFLSIHAPAPQMVAPTMRTAQKLMERIMADRPVWRASWNFKIWNDIDLSSRHNEAYNRELSHKASSIDANNIGSQLYIRIERQTISRLPLTNCILFGIHMYQNLLCDEAADPDRARRMYQVLQSTPPEMLRYKAITPFLSALLQYLQSRINSSAA